MIPSIVLAIAGEMDTFVSELVFGDLSWLYLVIILGILFLISWKIRAFCVVSLIVCLFLMRIYTLEGITIEVMWKIIIFGASMIIFTFKLAGHDIL